MRQQPPKGDGREIIVKPSSLQIAETVAGIDRQPATIFQAFGPFTRELPPSARKTWLGSRTTLFATAGLRAGDPVAVQGVGGLGHLGIQLARHMGFRTAAIGRGREKE
jgi:NADPH:quinone reductase-like Zn-dependent oxidoreductase